MVVMEFIMLEIEVNRNMERVWGELVPKLEEGSVDVMTTMGNNINQQQGTVVNNLPPSQLPPPVPIAATSVGMPPSSQPMYSNVPAPMPAVDPMMESSIQYRDNNLSGMGL